MSKASTQKITTKRFLVGVLIVLIAMLLFLAYLYYSLSRPIGAGAYENNEYRPLLTIYGKSSKPEDLLKRPNDVAFDRSGNVYITDSENGRVFVFDSSKGRFLRQIGKKGRGKGELQVPVGIAVARDGTTFVVDKALNKVSIFGKNGAPKKDFPVPHPMKPLVAGDRLYVTTAWTINIYSLDGRELAKFGRKGKALGELSYPFGIAVDSTRIFVAEPANLRVQAFKKDGGVAWVKGKAPSDIYGQGRVFGLPAGLALGSDNRLYLVDSFYHQIDVMTKDGKVIKTFGQQGTRDGELNYPAGIASRGDGVFAVADKYNDRVQIIKITVGD